MTPSPVLDRSSQDIVMLQWLVRNKEQIRQHPDAARMWREVRKLRARAEAMIDNASPDTFCGLCQCEIAAMDVEDDVLHVRVGEKCGGEVYRSPGDEHGICDRCGTASDPDTLTEWALGQARDQWRRPAEIVRLLRTYGFDLDFGKLKVWISRDKKAHDEGRLAPAGRELILQRGVDDDGRAVYRVGDVLDRVTANETRTA